ncbi:MAG: type II secretion system F family protein [Patescibacteria group bacterium]
MPFFEYKAKNTQGRIFKGKAEASTQEDIVEMLSEKGMFPLSVEAVRESKDFFANIDFLNKVGARDLVLLSRQLSVMKSANLPIVQSLRILEKQTENPKLKAIVAEITDEVDGGAKLSQAMSNYPKVFSDFFVAVIRSGETSGRLDEVLSYLADQQEKDYDLMSKIKGAMIYPAFIVGGLAIVGVIMMVFVVPKLTDILAETGQELPIATKILIGTSQIMSNYWWLLLVGVVVIFLSFRSYLGTSRGSLLFDILKIKMPIFGKLFQRICLVRFTRSMATLLAGGVPLVDSLRVTSDIVGNRVYEDIINQTVKEVEDGNPVSTIFLQSKDVPVMVSRMMSVGEQTGHMDKVLEKLTDFYSREIDNLVTNLVSLIEPLIMVVLGVAVGVMVAAIIMPMYNMASGF